MKLTEDELDICENGLVMERLKQRKKRAQRKRLDKKILNNKLKKAELYWPRIAMYAKYDEDYENAIYLRWTRTRYRKYLKTFSNRMVRRSPDEALSGKSGRYKKFVEYWWEIY